MPKTSESTNKECHDCGQSGPEWCSINHGILICDECCSIHLSLGRHISQIKSFKRSYWPPAQLNLINELSNNGANLVWEYGLLDPQNKVPRKKPSAKDSITTKADFIRTKYQQMSYINRLKDETNVTFEDLHLQLHSIARTDNVVTCLRFLSQGADPNFKNPETGTSSVHVAASRGQYNQVELLCIFGGDPAAVDNAGISPEEHARANGYSDLADRLIELQYELTDRLIYFIGGKRPDHKTGQHIVLPELTDNLEQTDQSRLARRKLQQLPDLLFEDLAMDVFDEVERRELNTIWHAQVEKALIPLHVVPFLPVNPAFSATRNQGRQKLARYGPKEFTTFISDILNEVRRRLHGNVQQSPVSITSKFHTLPRQNNSTTNNVSNTNNASISTQDIVHVNGPTTTLPSVSSTTALINAFIDSDDEPLYDKVASDEDYSSLPNHTGQHKPTKTNKKSKKLSDYSVDGLLQSPSESLNLSDVSNEETVRIHRPNDLKSRVAQTEVQMKYLACAHIDLKNELAVLHQMIQRLLDESLLNKVDQQVANDGLTTHPSQVETNTSVLLNGNGTNQIVNKSAQQLFDNHSRKSSPIVESDYDNTTLIDDPDNPLSNLVRQVYGYEKRSSRSVHRFPPMEENSTNALNNSRPFRSTDWINNNVEKTLPTQQTQQLSQASQKSTTPTGNGRARSCSGGRNKAMSPPILSRKGSCGQAEMNGDIDKRTRKITHRIAELFSLIKENQFDRFVTCAERINNSVQEMIRLFDRMVINDEIRANLEMLNTGAQQLLVHAILKDKNPTNSSTPTIRTEQIQSIIDDCYNIALSTKGLVSLYQKP